jgi:7-cyano-7-deazaguanine synthase in queuosine biosynthesis
MKVVRYVGKGRGLPPEYKKAVTPGSRATVINNLRDGRNVTVEIKLDDKAVEFDNDPLSRDFLDLSTLIYIVDELELRRKAKDHWSRRFDVIAPVKKPKLWQKHGDIFRKMLRTLAGDEYEFSWCNRPNLDSLGHHRVTLPSGFDSVCLFSGGMDSFLGAYKLLSEGQRLLLVGHQADSMAAPAQKALAKWLQHKFPDACHLVQWRVAHSLAETHKFPLRRPKQPEDSHRVRSLLFIALAVSVANATGATTIYLPENGLIAINPPLQKSRLGTLSTRTAHPRYLGELLDFLQAMGIYTGEIKNPFLFDSKTDMLWKRKSLAKPLLRAVSCSRPSRYKNKGVKHCGYCVPCIYRRVAMMEIGLDASSDYAFSVFDGFANLKTHMKLDFRALVRWAEKVVVATPVERELMVLSHGSFPLSAAERFGPHASDSYGIWAKMLLRWSEDFLSKVDSVATPDVKRALGRAVRKGQVSR